MLELSFTILEQNQLERKLQDGICNNLAHQLKLQGKTYSFPSIIYPQ